MKAIFNRGKGKMNISALNSVPANSSTSFGRDYQIEDAEHIIELSEELSDSFQKAEKPEIKSKGAIFASVIGAVLTTFVVGKCAAAKVTTAFPSLSTKITDGLRKGADCVKNYSDDVANGVKLQKGGKYTKFVGEKVGIAENFARNEYKKLANKMGAEGIIRNAAGVGAVVAIAPEILSVDGNEDGVSDIAQKNVNAYKNAVRSLGIVSDIIESLS